MTTVQYSDDRPGSVRPYLCWAVVLVLGFYNLVYQREVMISMMAVLGMGDKLVLLADKVGFFLFGAIGLLIILVTEPYFRKGWQLGILRLRFLQVVILMLAWLSISWAILMGLPGLADAARPSILRLAGAAAALTAAGLLYRRETERQ